MAAPHYASPLIEKPALCLECAVSGQDIAPVTMVPEDCFVRYDEIRAYALGTLDDVCGGSDAGDDASAFCAEEAFSIEYLVACCLWIDGLACEGIDIAAVASNRLDSLFYLHRSISLACCLFAVPAGEAAHISNLGTFLRRSILELILGEAKHERQDERCHETGRSRYPHIDEIGSGTADEDQDIEDV